MIYCVAEIGWLAFVPFMNHILLLRKKELKEAIIGCTDLQKADDTIVK